MQNLQQVCFACRLQILCSKSIWQTALPDTAEHGLTESMLLRSTPPAPTPPRSVRTRASPAKAKAAAAAGTAALQRVTVAVPAAASALSSTLLSGLAFVLPPQHPVRRRAAPVIIPSTLCWHEQLATKGPCMVTSCREEVDIGWSQIADHLQLSSMNVNMQCCPVMSNGIDMFPTLTCRSLRRLQQSSAHVEAVCHSASAALQPH